MVSLANLKPATTRNVPKCWRCRRDHKKCIAVSPESRQCQRCVALGYNCDRVGGKSGMADDSVEPTTIERPLETELLTNTKSTSNDGSTRDETRTSTAELDVSILAEDVKAQHLAQENRVAEIERLCANVDRQSQKKDLRRFASEFRLRTPTPSDLVAILAKDPKKQEDVISKPQREHELANAMLPKRDAEQDSTKESEGKSLDKLMPISLVPQRPQLSADEQKRVDEFFLPLHWSRERRCKEKVKEESKTTPQPNSWAPYHVVEAVRTRPESKPHQSKPETSDEIACSPLVVSSADWNGSRLSLGEPVPQHHFVGTPSGPYISSREHTPTRSLQENPQLRHARDIASVQRLMEKPPPWRDRENESSLPQVSPNEPFSWLGRSGASPPRHNYLGESFLQYSSMFRGELTALHSSMSDESSRFQAQHQQHVLNDQLYQQYMYFDAQEKALQEQLYRHHESTERTSPSAVKLSATTTASKFTSSGRQPAKADHPYWSLENQHINLDGTFLASSKASKAGYSPHVASHDSENDSFLGGDKMCKSTQQASSASTQQTSISRGNKIGTGISSRHNLSTQDHRSSVSANNSYEQVSLFHDSSAVLGDVHNNHYYGNTVNNTNNYYTQEQPSEFVGGSYEQHQAFITDFLTLAARHGIQTPNAPFSKDKNEVARWVREVIEAQMCATTIWDGQTSIAPPSAGTSLAANISALSEFSFESRRGDDAQSLYNNATPRVGLSPETTPRLRWAKTKV